MKRAAPWLLVSSVVLAVATLFLCDPFDWFATAPADSPLAHPEARGPVAPERPEAPLATTGGDSAERVAAVVERREFDPLVASGLASLRVLGPADVPVAEAQVLVVRSDELLSDQRTDEKGEVELPADGLAARVFLALPHRPLEECEVVLDPGRHDLPLAAGLPLTLRFVREDGTSPGALRIGIDSDRSPTSVTDVPAVVEDVLVAGTLGREYMLLDTAADGTLALSGLPPFWGARLVLRGGWKVVSTSHGDIEPNAWGIRLAEPTTGVVVRVAPLPVLRGRLVLRDDGTPLTLTRLSAMLRSPDVEEPTFTSALTDEDGRFELQYRGSRIGSVDLRLGGRFHEGPSILVREGAGLPADGELGDIAVDGVRHVPFLLRDVEGSPIARGVAVAAGTQSNPTGEDGRGELRWLARPVDRMVVEATGFVPAARDIPAVIVDPLVVTMELANELVVNLMLPKGADPTQFKVVLRGEERITAAPVADSVDQHRHVSEWTYPLVEFMGRPEDTYLCARPDATESRVTFFALRPGVEIELRVHGITGDMVYHSQPLAPLAAGEHREMDVSLEDGMIVFRGHVRDQDGRALSRAHLQLGNQILGWTDGEGSFECFLAGPETGTLLIQHQACATQYLSDYTVPTDGAPVEFRLAPARRVEIEVVDVNGTPVPQGEVWLEHGGFITNTHRIEGNRHVARSVPETPFVLMVRLAGREYRQEHEPEVPEARFVVPVHGRVTARIDAASTTGRAGRFLLVLVPSAEDGGGSLVESRVSAPDLRIEFGAVLPGTYGATLHYIPTADEMAAGREESESEGGSLVVEPGKDTELRLALPVDAG